MQNLETSASSDSDPVAAPLSDAPLEPQSEIEDYLAVSQQRRRVLPRAALVGLAAGLMAALFRLSLSGADGLRNAMLAWAHTWPWVGWVAPVVYGAGGAALSVALVRRLAPEASGSGIPHLEAVLHRFRTLVWQRVLPVKFIAGVLALGSGLAMGREGPTVQMGGATGDAIAQLLRSRPRERRTLIAAGAGAGLAAAFNAPLSGLTFVLEEVQRDFHPIVFAAAFIAAVIADIVARVISGPDPVFAIPSYPAQALETLPVFAVLGVLAGVLGVAFNRGLLATLNLTARLKGRQVYVFAAVMGACVGVVGWFAPEGAGNGHGLAEAVLAGRMTLMLIPLWFLLRFALTLGSYGTGAAGGIFAPLLVLGALLGLGTGEVAGWFSPALAPQPAVFAVVGMAAYFTAIVRAPLTGILLIVEMTGNYEQMLPLLVSCFCAYAVAEALRELPIYESLLERDLARNGPATGHGEPMVVDIIVEPDSPFAGRRVQALGLPPACVIVRCLHDGRELVPTAQTLIEPHMRLTVVIGSGAVSGLAVLRHGCRAGDDPPEPEPPNTTT